MKKDLEQFILQGRINEAIIMLVNLVEQDNVYGI